MFTSRVGTSQHLFPPPPTLAPGPGWGREGDPRFPLVHQRVLPLVCKLGQGRCLVNESG